MRDVIDVIEGSVVPSGSQGTGFVAQERAQSLERALDNARQLHHRPVELWTKRLWEDE
jgi:hypothetical protein